MRIVVDLMSINYRDTAYHVLCECCGLSETCECRGTGRRRLRLSNGAVMLEDTPGGALWNFLLAHSEASNSGELLVWPSRLREARSVLLKEYTSGLDASVACDLMTRKDALVKLIDRAEKAEERLLIRLPVWV